MPFSQWHLQRTNDVFCVILKNERSDMSLNNSATRRKFLQATAVTAAAGLLPTTLRAAKQSGDVNSQVRVAVIGVHGRGVRHMDGLAAHVVALCDCDSAILAKRAKQFEEKHGRKVDIVVDYRKLLERSDIDAVAIATPNHTHSLIGIAAAQAGKHVYCEKPVSHNIWEGRQLTNTAEKYKRIMQCGTQSRSAQGIQDALAWVQEGNIGDIRYAIGTCYKPRKSIGKLKESLRIPSSVDYDLWCGPAAEVDLHRPKLHYDWHWDFNTGNGDMGNQGIHQMDVARWFLGHKGLSPRVISVGGRLGYDDAGDTPNTQVVLHDYPERPIIFETRGLPKSKAGQRAWGSSMDRYRGSQIGVVVQCERGHVVIPSWGKIFAFNEFGNELKKWNTGDCEQRHFDNFVAAVRAGDSSMLSAPIVEGHVSSGLCHTGNISHLLGKKLPADEIAKSVAGNDLLASSVDRMMYHLRMNEVDVDQPAVVLGELLEMDAPSEQFTNNEAANRLLRRKERKPFIVPEIS